MVAIGHVTDSDIVRQIGRKAGAAVGSAGGRFIARTDHVIALSGHAIMRFVVIAFGSLDQARALNASPPQDEVDDIADRSTQYRRFIAEAMPG